MVTDRVGNYYSTIQNLVTMTHTKIEHGGTRTSHIFHAEVPFIKAPKIIAEIFTLCGDRYYLGPGKKLYVADLFDKMFKCAKGKIKSIRYKGALIGQKY
jgi:hypothetical protein